MRVRNVCLVAGLFISTTASAMDHVMHVNEIVLDGGAGEQYIELHDPNNEPLPSPAYTLRIYDDAGAMVESVNLPGISGDSDAYYLVGNEAATGTYTSATFSQTFVNPLPTPGQACFVRDNNSKVHCIAWACPSAPILGATRVMSAPPSGMSIAYQTTGQLHFSVPTPGAANSTGTVATLCPMPLPDAGVAGDGGGNPNNPDAGTGGGSDDGSGCCQSTSSPSGVFGGAALALLVLGSVLRRRRRAAT